MGKRFSFRISRVFPSFPSWRSKPGTSPPAFCLSPTNPKTHNTTTTTTRRLAPVVSSSGCRCGPRRSTPKPTTPIAAVDLSYSINPSSYLCCKDDYSSPRLKIDSDDNSSIFYQPPLTMPRRRRPTEKTKKPKNKTKKKSRFLGPISTSSADSGWFSSQEEEEEEEEEHEYDNNGDETDTLLSSFDTDSSEVMQPRCRRRRAVAHCPSPETGSPEKAKVLERLSSVVAREGKVTEGFAVVKRSKDPHGDFRRSMAEMVLEKQIYDAAGLEQLLQCFLSLNSRVHHVAIVAAFADIWDAVFPATTPAAAAARVPAYLR